MDIKKRTKQVVATFGGTEDLITKELITDGGRFTFIYIDAMIDKNQLELGIIRPIMSREGNFLQTLEGLKTVLCTSIQIKSYKKADKAIEFVSSGECMLLMENSEEYYILPLRFYPMRAVQEPPTSAVLKGPREGYTEDVKTNIVLTRRRIRSNKLVCKMLKVGRYTETSIAIMYINGIAKDSLVKELYDRISSIDIDGILDSSYISKFLEAKEHSLFKQVGTAEKPDIIAAKLLEGRVAIIVDGSPIVITLPFMLLEDFQDSQDYFKRNARTSVIRVLRITAVFFALLLPAVFVALQTHQFQMIPLKLLITIINSINGIPFSPILEMLIALVLFEILGEASIRMPRYVGMALSIVGAIVLGETAVSAGLLSSITVLITALSGIGLYAIPDEVGTFSVLRILFVLLAGAVGILGIILGGIALLSYLVTLEIYGVPYMAPFAPMIPSDLKDGILKGTLKNRKTRPEALRLNNKTRQGDNE